MFITHKLVLLKYKYIHSTYINIPPYYFNTQIDLLVT